MSDDENIPLHVLVCDVEGSSRELLFDQLNKSKIVSKAAVCDSLTGARDHLQSNRTDAIFVDVLSLGIEECSSFIFEVRKQKPEIVFVLFCDRVSIEESRSTFYRGERRRFSHYFRLDKGTPASEFKDEVDAVLRSCIYEFRRNLPESHIKALQAEARELSARNSSEENKELRDLLAKLAAVTETIRPNHPNAEVRRNTVFISYRFNEEEYFDTLSDLLTKDGFECVTGGAANGSVSAHVVDKIRRSEFFVSLMTRGDEKADGNFAPSPWLLEERGAAAAFGKHIVFMVEQGVTDHGGILGDLQQIRFTAKGFYTASQKALRQLRSYSGRG